MATQKRAYSYIRFSRAHQIEGDSLRRQSASTVDYCRQHKLLLDESLNLRDLGVSAFKGRNAKKGALGRFITACETGLVPRGSALIVESLDRLSRQSARKTVRLMTELLDDHGIEIHLTMAGKVFKPENEDGVDLIFAVALAMRANEESETKSKRLKEAFARKRQEAAEGKTKVSSSLPWWLVWDKPGKGKKDGSSKIICPPERQKVILRIFENAATGISSNQIARNLNSEGVPTWRKKSTIWTDNRIRDAIRSDAPIGTIMATTKTKKAGEPWKIEGYYPAVIPTDLAAEARAYLVRNRKTGRPAEGVLNLLRGIARYKNLWCRFSVHRPQIGGWNGYYEAVSPDRKMPWSVSANQLEPILLAAIAELTPETIMPPSDAVSDAAALRANAKDTEARIANIGTAIEAGSVTMAPRLVELEKELAAIREELEVTDAEGKIMVDISALTQLARYDAMEVKDAALRPEIASAIRRLVKRVELGSTLNDLITDKRKTVMTIEDGDTIVENALPDPTGSRGKHPLAILVHFHGGGQLAIQRQTENTPPGSLLITRVIREGQPIVI